MKIKDVDTVCMIDIEGIIISKSDTKDLKRLYDKKPDLRIGINLKNVKDFDSSFLFFLRESAKKRKFALYNLTTELYLLLFVLKHDLFCELYMNEEDFIKRKRNIVHRRLRLLKAA